MDMTSLVSSKGRMTIPVTIRKALKIGTLHRRVRFELCKDGSAKLYPVADALSVQGALADPSRPYDPKEREKAWAAHAKEVVRKGRR